MIMVERLKKKQCETCLFYISKCSACKGKLEESDVNDPSYNGQTFWCVDGGAKHYCLDCVEPSSFPEGD